MKDSLYVKLEDHKEYKEKLRKIAKLVDDLDENFEKLDEIRKEEDEYIHTWKDKSDSVKEKLDDTAEVLDINL